MFMLPTIKHIETVYGCAAELSKIFFDSPGSDSGTMKKIQLIGTGNMVLDILDVFSVYGLNPNIPIKNAKFQDANPQIWNFIMCKVYGYEPKDNLFDWNKFRLPSISKAINFDKQNFCTVMEALLIFYTEYVVVASKDKKLKPFFHFTHDAQETGNQFKTNCRNLIPGGNRANMAYTYIPNVSLLEAGATSNHFWNKRMSAMNPAEFPLTWKDGYQIKHSDIVGMDTANHGEYMDKRMEFINMNEDGTPSTKTPQQKRKIANKKKMYHGIIGFNWDNPDKYDFFVINDNKTYKSDKKIVVVTFHQFIENIFDRRCSMNYYKYITKSSIIPIKTDETKSTGAQAVKPPPRLDVSRIPAATIDKMSYDLSEEYDTNMVPWSDLVNSTVNVCDILMNCFHQENIIYNEHGYPVMNPETIDLARMCIHDLKKKAESKKSHKLRKMNLPNEVESVKELKRNWDPSIFEVYAPLANILMRERAKQCKKLKFTQKLQDIQKELVARSVISDEKHEVCEPFTDTFDMVMGSLGLTSDDSGDSTDEAGEAVRKASEAMTRNRRAKRRRQLENETTDNQDNHRKKRSRRDDKEEDESDSDNDNNNDMAGN